MGFPYLKEFTARYLKPSFTMSLCSSPSAPLARRSRIMSAVTSVNTNANLWPCCGSSKKKTSHDHVYLGHRWSPKLENSIWPNIKHESWFGRGVLGERRKTMKRTNLEFGMIPNWQLLTGSDPQVYLNSLLWAQWRKVSRGGEMSSNIRHALAQHFPILLARIEGWSHIPKHTRHTYLSFYMAMGASCAQLRSRNGPKLAPSF